MSARLVLALVDAAVGTYLLWYAGCMQRRNREALLVTAVLLLLAAVALGLAGQLPQPGRISRLPPLAPAGEMV